jgi:hypothetical protein
MVWTKACPTLQLAKKEYKAIFISRTVLDNVFVVNLQVFLVPLDLEFWLRVK